MIFYYDKNKFTKDSCNSQCIKYSLRCKAGSQLFMAHYNSQQDKCTVLNDNIYISFINIIITFMPYLQIVCVTHQLQLLVELHIKQPQRQARHAAVRLYILVLFKQQPSGQLQLFNSSEGEEVQHERQEVAFRQEMQGGIQD